MCPEQRWRYPELRPRENYVSAGDPQGTPRVPLPPVPTLSCAPPAPDDGAPFGQGQAGQKDAERRGARQPEAQEECTGEWCSPCRRGGGVSGGLQNSGPPKVLAVLSGDVETLRCKNQSNLQCYVALAPENSDTPECLLIQRNPRWHNARSSIPDVISFRPMTASRVPKILGNNDRQG